MRFWDNSFNKYWDRMGMEVKIQVRVMVRMRVTVTREREFTVPESDTNSNLNLSLQMGKCEYNHTHECNSTDVVITARSNEATYRNASCFCPSKCAERISLYACFDSWTIMFRFRMCALPCNLVASLCAWLGRGLCIISEQASCFLCCQAHGHLTSCLSRMIPFVGLMR